MIIINSSHIVGELARQKWQVSFYFAFVLIIFQAKKEQASVGDKSKAASKNAQGAKKGGKTKKKSWTKVKVRDKLNNEVFLDQKRYEKVVQEMTKMLTISRSVLCEKFKVNGAIARALIKDGIKKGHIKEIGDHSARFDLCSGV